jgi:hypothetical protein
MPWRDNTNVDPRRDTAYRTEEERAANWEKYGGGYAYQHFFGCLSSTNDLWNDIDQNGYTAANTAQLTDAQRRCGKDGQQHRNNSIRVSKYYQYKLNEPKPNTVESPYPASNLIISVSTNAWDVISPGNEGKGRIWIPA